MSYELRFDLRYSYDTRLVGITVPVVLVARERATTATAKLDTGASFSVFDRLVGEDLGLDIESGDRQSLGTFAGSLIVYGHEVLLLVGDLEFPTIAYFASDYGLPRNVLGRPGFLNRVLLGLDDQAGSLYLSRSVGEADGR